MTNYRGSKGVGVNCYLHIYKINDWETFPKVGDVVNIEMDGASTKLTPHTVTHSAYPELSIKNDENSKDEHMTCCSTTPSHGNGWCFSE